MLYIRNVFCLSAIFLTILVSLSGAMPSVRDNTIPEPHKLPARRGLRLGHEPSFRLASSGRTSNSLRTRDWKLSYLDDGWALYFHKYHQYVWIENAASTLERFFDSIAASASGPWLNQAPVKAFTIELGELLLEFRSSIEVPMNFVAMFAQSMANSVRNGFSGAFEAIIENLITGGAVYVKLKASLGGRAAGAA